MAHIAGAVMSVLSVALVIVLSWRLRSAVGMLPEEEQDKLRLAREALKHINLASLLLSAIAIGAISLLSALGTPPFSRGQALAVSLPLMWVMFGVPLALLDEVAVLNAAISNSALGLAITSWLLCVSIAIVPVALSTLSVQLLMACKLAGLSESFSGCAFAVALISLSFLVTVAVNSHPHQKCTGDLELACQLPVLMRAMTSTAATTLMMTLAISIHHSPAKGNDILIVAYPVVLSTSLIIGWHIANGVILIGGARWVKLSQFVHPIVTAPVFVLLGSVFTHASIKPYSHPFMLGAIAFFFVAMLHQLLSRSSAMDEGYASAAQQLGIATSLITLGMIAMAFAAYHGYGVGLASIGFLPTVHFAGVLASCVKQTDSEFRREQLWRVVLASNLPVLVLAMRLMCERQVRSAFLPAHSPIVLVSACVGALSFPLLSRLISNAIGDATAGAEHTFAGFLTRSLLTFASISLIAIGFVSLLPLLWGVNGSLGFVIGVAISILVLCAMPSLHLPSSVKWFALIGFSALALVLCIGIVHTTQFLLPVSLRPRLFRVWLFIGLLLFIGTALGLLRVVQWGLKQRS